VNIIPITHTHKHMDAKKSIQLYIAESSIRGERDSNFLLHFGSAVTNSNVIYRRCFASRVQTDGVNEEEKKNLLKGKIKFQINFLPECCVHQRCKDMENEENAVTRSNKL
jgi:hypothetical protein